MFRTIERYEERSLGLPYPIILLNGAEEEIDDDTGERVGVSIRHMEGLVATIAIARALCPLQLDGAEVRFIRRAIGMNSKAFAESLALDPATFSRWETGKQTVGDWADKQVRMAAIIMLGDRAPGVKADQKSVVGLRTIPRHSGATVHFEMRLSTAPNLEGADDDSEWEMKLAA